jgi:hypothetical protein
MAYHAGLGYPRIAEHSGAAKDHAVFVVDPAMALLSERALIVIHPPFVPLTISLKSVVAIICRSGVVVCFRRFAIARGGFRRQADTFSSYYP